MAGRGVRLKVAGQGFPPRRTLRQKLVLLVLVPILVLAPVNTALLFRFTESFTRAQLLRQVRADLGVADHEFTRMQRDYLRRLQGFADSYRFHRAFASGDLRRLRLQLATLRRTAGFDFLGLGDRRGAAYGPGLGPVTIPRSPQYTLAVQRGVAGVGLEVLGAAALRAEDGELARRARIALRPTRRAAPSRRRVERRALVVRAVVPVRDRNGSTVAVLDGGVLLNRNFAVVDTLRDLVYPTGSLLPGSFGAVTVLLGDVRVSTNVPSAPGQRALGTRVSRAVRDSVLGQGNVWVARAFVVNRWFISAYEPLIDAEARRVGMLYVGFLAAPYVAARHQALAVAVAVFLLGAVLAAGFALLGARRIFRPIEAIARVVRGVREGRDERIGAVHSNDEIGELAGEFDSMLDALRERNRQLRLATGNLEQTVAERTAALTRQNERLGETVALLREAREQLFEAEKLAALGELTAGVAHEINNPVAVILGNMELLCRELGPRLAPVATETGLVIEQAERIRTIVDKLLRFSRPAQFPSAPRPMDLREAIEGSLLLVGHELQRKGLQVETRYAASTRVAFDPAELEQVLVNLLLNAAHASGEGQRIEISTREWPEGAVIAVVDHGHGIAAEHLRRVFDPFFSTGRAEGTGLGLSVSYGLVRRYGGDLRVHSEPGAGATFEVWLRREPPPADPDASSADG